MKSTLDILKEAKAVKSVLCSLDSEEKNKALLKMADALEENCDAILEANSKDMENAKGTISDVMLDRLCLTKERIKGMADGIREVVALPDPVGEVLARVERPSGIVKITDIKYIVVNSEEDALLLENNLIKKYKPRYNVLLKDDKTYPSICVSNEYFPRVFKTRNIVRNGSIYYGPYSHIPSMNALLDLIKKLYPLRTCHHALTPENIQDVPMRNGST